MLTSSLKNDQIPTHAPETMGLCRDEIIDRMQIAAPQGLEELCPDTSARLQQLTNELLVISGKEGLDTLRYYCNTENRELALPLDQLKEIISNKRVLVTGGTGLIGSKLMLMLAEFGPQQLVSVSRGEMQPYTFVEQATYQYADLRDKDALRLVFERAQPDIIYHVAADKYNGEAEKRAVHTLTTNIEGTKNVLELAQEFGTERFVYASTGKATRLFSPDIYASSKKAGEWLVYDTAQKSDMLCAAGRFTHVVDQSSLIRRIQQWIDEDRPISLHNPDIWFYIQSARESAQLLLNATLSAERHVMNINAIRNLGDPVNLANIGIGAIAHSAKQTSPIYFKGYEPGYEERHWPELYDPMTAGDVSPLINAIEAPDTKPSDTCPEVDVFPLVVGQPESIRKTLINLINSCKHGAETDEIRTRNHALSAEMLEGRLQALPEAVIQRAAKRILKRRAQNGHLPWDHDLTDTLIISKTDSI